MQGGSGTILLFNSTHDAMRAEEAIINAGFWNDMVPRPPDSTSTLCGLAIEVQSDDIEDIRRLLNEEDVFFDIYQPAK